MHFFVYYIFIIWYHQSSSLVLTDSIEMNISAFVFETPRIHFCSSAAQCSALSLSLVYLSVSLVYFSFSLSSLSVSHFSLCFSPPHFISEAVKNTVFLKRLAYISFAALCFSVSLLVCPQSGPFVCSIGLSILSVSQSVSQVRLCSV